METAVFSGGCFRAVEAVFEHVKGVRSAVSGYSGGSAQSARYEIVSSVGTQYRSAIFYANETQKAAAQAAIAHHPDQPYIVVNDLPKLAALKHSFPALYR